MTAEVPLTRGLVALVDNVDLALVGQYRWVALCGTRTWYAHRSGVRRPGGGYTGQLMHTLLTGWPRVDHINGNGLDNRRANLRPASAMENGQNSRKRRRGTSRYKGVHWSKRRRGWVAMIYLPAAPGEPRRAEQLGRFDTETAAAHAYDDAARRYFSSFAMVNFPTGNERSALADAGESPEAAERIKELTKAEYARVRSRLTAEEVAEVLSRADAGESFRSIALRLGRAHTTIGRIVYNRHVLVLPSIERGEAQ